jgi:hypothetical protein
MIQSIKLRFKALSVLRTIKLMSGGFAALLFLFVVCGATASAQNQFQISVYEYELLSEKSEDKYSVFGSKAAIDLNDFQRELQAAQFKGHLKTLNVSTGIVESGNQLVLYTGGAIAALPENPSDNLKFITLGRYLEATPQIISGAEEANIRVKLAFKIENNQIDSPQSPNESLTREMAGVLRHSVSSVLEFSGNQVIVLGGFTNGTSSNRVYYAVSLRRLNLKNVNPAITGAVTLSGN